MTSIVIRNPRVVAAANGTKSLLNAILEPKFEEIADSITAAFLYLLDHESLRCYLRPHYDIEVQ